MNITEAIAKKEKVLKFLDEEQKKELEKASVLLAKTVLPQIKYVLTAASPWGHWCPCIYFFNEEGESITRVWCIDPGEEYGWQYGRPSAEPWTTIHVSLRDFLEEILPGKI